MAILKFHKGNFRVKGKTLGLPLKTIWALAPLSYDWWRVEGPKSILNTFWGLRPNRLVVGSTGLGYFGSQSSPA